MSDKVVLTIALTPEEHQQIEDSARPEGHDTPADHVRALIERLAEREARIAQREARIDELIAELEQLGVLRRDQLYFWTDEWQAAERKVDEEIAAGQYKDFATMDEFLADLTSDDE